MGRGHIMQGFTVDVKESDFYPNGNDKLLNGVKQEPGDQICIFKSSQELLPVKNGLGERRIMGSGITLRRMGRQEGVWPIKCPTVRVMVWLGEGCCSEGRG